MYSHHNHNNMTMSKFFKHHQRQQQQQYQSNEPSKTSNKKKAHFIINEQQLNTLFGTSSLSLINRKYINPVLFLEQYMMISCEDRIRSSIAFDSNSIRVIKRTFVKNNANDTASAAAAEVRKQMHLILMYVGGIITTDDTIASSLESLGSFEIQSQWYIVQQKTNLSNDCENDCENDNDDDPCCNHTYSSNNENDIIQYIIQYISGSSISERSIQSEIGISLNPSISYVVSRIYLSDMLWIDVFHFKMATEAAAAASKAQYNNNDYNNKCLCSALLTFDVIQNRSDWFYNNVLGTSVACSPHNSSKYNIISNFLKQNNKTTSSIPIDHHSSIAAAADAASEEFSRCYHSNNKIYVSTVHSTNGGANNMYDDVLFR